RERARSVARRSEHACRGAGEARRRPGATRCPGSIGASRGAAAEDGRLNARDAHPAWMPVAIPAAAGSILALGRTWRIETHGVREIDRALEAGERCIFAFWHARMLPLVYTHRRRAITVLVSRHRDGEWIARVIERLGFTTARGSSTRGGEEGVREMLVRAG